MRRLKHLQYWLLGLCVLGLCVVGQPAIARSPQAPASSPTVTLAQGISAFEERAQAAYGRGDYQAAAALLQQAQQQYRADQNLTQAAIALSNLSLTYQQLGDWPAARAALDEAWAVLGAQPTALTVQAQMLDVQGQLEFAQGQIDQALATWQRSDDIYGQLGNPQRQALSRLNQVQALQAKGLFQQVQRSLTTLAGEVSPQPPTATKASILRQLGDSLRATGNLDAADQRLQESLQVAEQVSDPALIAASYLSLGNLAQGRFKRAVDQQDLAGAIAHADAALAHYQQVAARDQGTLGVQARLNVMQLLTHPRLARWDLAIAFYPTLQTGLPQLPPGRATIMAYTGLAETLITLRQQRPATAPSWADIATLLAPVQAQAQTLQDPRSQSLVLGTLGHLYEQTQQRAIALDLSRQALALAQQAQADDIRYRWEWQLGRLFKAEQQTAPAIAAYTAAYETLNGLRSDLITANPDVQFSFREQVEPVYRELVDLLVSEVPELGAPQGKATDPTDQARLRQARDVMEALQVAELENFFQAACIDKTVSIDEVVNEEDTTAAVVYTMLLRDRLEVVLKLPQKDDLVHYAAPAPRAAIDALLDTYRAKLIRGTNIIPEGQQLYTWLLQPAVQAGLLTPDTIQTLIFLQDGALRLIPMTTLHDGTDFLVKTYAVSLVLGLDVRDPQALPPREQVQVLAASLQTPPLAERATYSPLPGVTAELEEIVASALPVTVLQDDAFTQPALDRQLQDTDYTIVHLATHGEFGSDRRNTYILAADGRLNIDALGQLFQSRRQADTRLEMLILSACKTATGDSREVLGIAGAMVQSGARSAIATLWSVDDRVSILFTEALYAELAQPNVSRAEALRRAQATLLDRYPDRPRYWAPYVLVGSWR